MSSDRVLWGLAGAGLLLRLALAWIAVPAAVEIADERTYLVHAAELRRTGAFETGIFVRPPLYFLFVAGAGEVAAWFGAASPRGLVSWLQCLASVATVVPVYRTARRMGGLRAARIAAAFLLFDPTLLAFTHLLWPETLFLLVVAIVFDGLHGLEARGPTRRAALGALFGVGMLLKPVLGLFSLLLAGWWVRRLGLRPALRVALPFVLAASVVVAPWAARNVARHGPSILLENQAAFNLWMGNDPSPPEEIVYRWRKIDDPVQRSRIGMARAWDSVSEDPVRFLGLAAVRTLNLWGLEFFAVRHMLFGGYGPVERSTLLATFWVVQAAWLLAALAAALGFRAAWRDPVFSLLAVHGLVFTLLVATMVGTTRFRVPFAFPICIAAGLGVDRLLSRGIGRRDLAAAALVLAWLALSSTRAPFRALASGGFESSEELRDPDWVFLRY